MPMAFLINHIFQCFILIWLIWPSGLSHLTTSNRMLCSVANPTAGFSCLPNHQEQLQEGGRWQSSWPLNSRSHARFSSHHLGDSWCGLTSKLFRRLRQRLPAILLASATVLCMKFTWRASYLAWSWEGGEKNHSFLFLWMPFRESFPLIPHHYPTAFS